MRRIFVVSLLCLAACSVPEEKKSRSTRRTTIGDACTSAQTGTQNCDANGDVIVCSGTQWILDTACPSATPCTMLAGGTADCGGGGNPGTCTAAEAGDEMCSNTTTIVMCNGTDWVFSQNCTGGALCDEDGAGGAGCVGGAGGTCTAGENGDEMCSNSTTIVTCNGTDWVFSQNCTGGTTCQDGGGIATCEGGGTTIPTCTYSGSEAPIYFDAQTFGFHDAYGTEPGGKMIEVQNFPGFGPGLTTAGTASMAGENSDFASCGTCVIAFDDSTQAFFLPNSGSLNFTALPATVGANFDVTFSNVSFREVTIDFQNYTSSDVPGGATFTITTYRLNGPATYYPCSLAGFESGDSACTQNDDIIGCGGDCVRWATSCGSGCTQVSSQPPYEAQCN
jgi:hypothetical protein